MNPSRQYTSKLKCLICDVPGLSHTVYFHTPKPDKATRVTSCECGWTDTGVSEMWPEDYLSDEEVQANISRNSVAEERTERLTLYIVQG